MKLSLQELIDCVDWATDGDGQRFSSRSAFDYIRKKGSTLKSFYPNDSSKRKPCRREENQGRLFISGYRLLKPFDEENLKIAVAIIGPIAVSIRITRNFFFYKSGVFYDSACRMWAHTTNHVVLLVGYGSSPDGGDFWVIQNNWGVGWGENSYARMARNSVINCAIASSAIYPVL